MIDLELDQDFFLDSGEHQRFRPGLDGLPGAIEMAEGVVVYDTPSDFSPAFRRLLPKGWKMEVFWRFSAGATQIHGILCWISDGQNSSLVDLFAIPIEDDIVNELEGHERFSVTTLTAFGSMIFEHVWPRTRREELRVLKRVLEHHNLTPLNVVELRRWHKEN